MQITELGNLTIVESNNPGITSEDSASNSQDHVFDEGSSNTQDKAELKGIDDLRGELKTIVNEVSSKKVNGDQKSKQFISDVEDTFKNVEKQVTEKNLDLNIKRKSLENITKTKIDSATDSIITSIDDLKNAYYFYRENYYNLTIPVAILIISVLANAFYDNIIAWNAKLSYSIPIIGFPLLKVVFIILVLYALARIWHNLVKVTDDFSIRSEKIRTKKKQLDNLSYVIPEDQLSPIQITDIKPFYSKTNEAFEDLVVSVAKSVPFIDNKFEDMTVLIKYQKVIENFRMALDYYKLLKDDNFFELIGRKAPAKARIINDESYWEQIIVKNIIGRLTLGEKAITPRTIQLVYYEYTGQDTTKIYRAILESNKELEDLARILLDSNLLTSPPTGIKYGTSDIVVVLKNVTEFKIPNINQTLIDYRITVEKFRSALDYYSLINYDEFSKLVTLSSINNIGNHADCEQQIINRIIDGLSKKNVRVTSNIIEILYREHNGLDTLNVLRNICKVDDELTYLSIILIKSNKLISPPLGYSYNTNDIRSVLKKIAKFNLSDMNKILIRCSKKMDYLNSYINFMNENGVASTFRPTIEFVIDEDNGAESVENQTIKQCLQVAIKLLEDFINYNEWIEGFAKASITLKFHIDHSFREYACKISSDDKSTAILRAYYSKSREVGRNSPVSIIELINDMQLINKEYENRDSIEFTHLKRMLNDGKWYDSSGAFLKEYLDIKTKEINDQLDDIKESNIFKEVISEQFINVKITTVEKAIDAQFFGAYIIIFSANEEELAPYVNMLSIRDLKNQGEKRWIEKTPYDKEEINREYGVYPKYDFMFYSKNTRIGFLNKNEDFVDFKNNFINDLKQILEIKYHSNKEPVKMGLAIQKITPVESNLGQLDNDGIEKIIAIKDLDFAHYISRLALDHLSPYEQAGLLVLEEKIDLLKVINYKNIYEIIKSDDIIPAEREALESDILLKKVLGYFQSEYGIGDLRRLALDLESKAINVEKITPVIENIFYNYLSSCKGIKRITFKRSQLLAKRFLNILVKLAVVYKVQKQV